MSLRHAIKTAPQHGEWADFLEVWKAADEIDLFEAAWNFDHFYPLTEPFSGPCLEGWTMLAALAQATSRIRIGCMVSAMHHRHPAVTANMTATIDIISGGRFDLGLGAGWNQMEDEAYGLGLGSIKDRLDRLEEGLAVISSLLSNAETTFRGRFYQLEKARCEPKGPQGLPPIVIGGKGKQRTLRMVAKYAWGWDCMFTPLDEWRELKEILVGHCREIGRDPNEITCMSHIRWPASADLGQLVEQAAAFHEAGLDLVVWGMGPPYQASRLESLVKALEPLNPPNPHS
ncbi:MAG TPA: TIGR03560 family F420-dependent LLM class oxidoreductase [Acidimicrobiia bacterium]|nr:TIGR03560 family F420-dependent LLM class oxidoreductase [Acidimicrobiia bacterium]